MNNVTKNGKGEERMKVQERIVLLKQLRTVGKNRQKKGTVGKKVRVSKV